MNEVLFILALILMIGGCYTGQLYIDKTRNKKTFYKLSWFWLVGTFFVGVFLMVWSLI